MKKLHEIRDKVINDTIISIETSIESSIINGQKTLRWTTKNEELYHNIIRILSDNCYYFNNFIGSICQENLSDGSDNEIKTYCVDIKIGL